MISILNTFLNSISCYCLYFSLDIIFFNSSGDDLRKLYNSKHDCLKLHLSNNNDLRVETLNCVLSAVHILFISEKTRSDDAFVPGKQNICEC